MALYFYTQSRPKHEIHGGHSTVYVLNPVPADFKVGEVITEDLHHAIHAGYKKRDNILDLAHKKEVIASTHFAALQAQNKHLLSEFRAPALGWAKQEGSVEGIFADHWLQASACGVFVAHRRITRAQLCFYLPESTPLPLTLCFAVDGAQVQATFAQSGVFELAVDVAESAVRSGVLVKKSGAEAERAQRVRDRIAEEEEREYYRDERVYYRDEGDY
jgi:hypothetical protein